MSKQYIFVTTFLALLVIAGGVLIYRIPSPVNSESSQEGLTSDTIESADTTTLGAETSAEQNMNDQLGVQDEVVGTGAEAVSGKSITVNYVGTLTNGTKFDSSYDRNQPFAFTLGAGEVIQGWDRGFTGMKVGGKRKLTIPPSLGYGAMDQGPIPANSTLIFEVELLSVQ